MRTDKMIGPAIKDARKSLGLTREAFAERVDMSPGYLANVENGTKNPSFRLVVKIARELGLSVDEVIYPEKSTVKDKKAELNEKINRCNEESLEILEPLINSLLNSQNKHER